MNVRCLACGYLFQGPIPPEQTTQLCDRCFTHAMRYVTSARTPRLVHGRIGAVHRLYGYTHPTPSSDRADACSEDAQTLDDPAGYCRECFAPTHDGPCLDPGFDPTDAEIAAGRPLRAVECYVHGLPVNGDGWCPDCPNPDDFDGAPLTQEEGLRDPGLSVADVIARRTLG